MSASKTSKNAAAAKSRKPTAAPASTETTPRAAAESKPKAKAASTPKLVKTKRGAKPKETDLVVFAIRLSEAERDAIHEAAGPARATKMIRAVAVAAAHGDVDGFKKALKEAEEARAKAAAK